MRSNWQHPAAVAIFALCIAPTFISFAPYSFRWDDSDYLWRSIEVGRAFWSADTHQMRLVMVSQRPPLMTLLGLPWGTLTSWNDSGKCFVTLAVCTALFVAFCLFMLLRVGLHPLYLAIASGCVFASLGPYPAGAHAHFVATSLLVDSLFAWVAFAAVLLIPYETSGPATSSVASFIARGALWAAIFSVGALTKLSFAYFIAATVPVLLVVRAIRSGLRAALLTLCSLTVFSLPVIFYWFRYGRTVWDNGLAASFGQTANFYFVPLSQFVSTTFRQSPGMWSGLILIAAGGAYLFVKRRDLLWSTSILPIVILVGYCMICLHSRNREIRFLFPGIVGFPFLIGVLISATARGCSRKTALILAAVVFCVLGLAAIPMRLRPNQKCLAASQAVLVEAIQSHAKRVLLGTDSSSLNLSLLNLAIAVSPARYPLMTEALTWNAASGTPIEDDFRHIRESDLVVFQNKEALDSPPTNLRASEYEQYARQQFGDLPLASVEGLRIYGRRHD
jgi:hypothetical protein